MTPGAFEYARAGSVREAIELLAANDGAKLLAGGHSLLPVMKLRLTVVPMLVDLGRIEELKRIEASAGGIRIGAMVSHARLERATELPRALRDAAFVIGDPAVRSRGTIGGSVAHADPAADLPPVLLALDATVHSEGPDGARSVPAAEFFRGLFETTLGEHDILTAVELPSAGRRVSAYVKQPDPASRYALVGCAVAFGLRDGRIEGARVAVGGLLPAARRLGAAERALEGATPGSEAFAAAAEAARSELDPDEVLGDETAGAEYRIALAGTLLRRALTRAAARAEGADE